MLALLEQYFGRYVALTESDLKILSGMVEVRSVNRKVRISDIGEVENYFNIVAQGLLRKFFVKGSEDVVKNIVREGGVLCSFLSFFAQTPSRCIVETIEPSVLLSINKANFDALFALDSSWELRGRMLVQDLLVEKEFWILDRLRYSSRERFLRFMEEQPELIQRVPQKYLASYLNIKPETFSRLKHLTLRKNAQPSSL